MRFQPFFRATLAMGMLTLVWALPAQTGGKPPSNESQASAAAKNRGMAYYHYSLGHLYQEMGQSQQRSEYISRAIEQYKLAMQFDPDSSHIAIELAELYSNTGRVRDAVNEAEAILKRDPKSVEARKLLGRIYAASLGQPQPGGVPRNQADTLRRAVEQFEQVVELDPKDMESHLILGRLYRLSNDFTKAEAILKKALAREPESDDARTTLASLYSDMGDGRSAAELMEKVAEKNPDPRVFAMLGQYYEQAKEHAKAVEALRRALQDADGNVELLRALGQNLLQSEQYDEALKVFQQALVKEPQDAQTHLRVGQIYRQKNQYGKALDSLKKAQVLAPDSMEITYNVALLHEIQGSPDEAARTLKKLLEETQKPAGTEYTAREKTNRAIFMERLGFLYRGQDKFEEALKYFRQLAETDTENPSRGALHVIDTLRQSRDYKAAQAEADSVVRKFPADVPVRLAHASLTADLGKPDEAVKSLRELLAKEPAKPTGDKEGEKAGSHREIWVTLVQILERAKRFPEAIEALGEVDKLSPAKEQKEFVYFLWGSVLEHAKKHEESEAQFRKALEINPDSSMVLNYLGYMLADRGQKLDEAVKMIARALEIDPQNGAYLDSLGWAYYRQNRLDLAEQYLLKAVQRVPRDATIRDHLGDLYFKTNRTREAIREWQRALTEYAGSLPADADPVEVTKVQKKLDDAKVRVAKEGNKN